MNRAKAILQQAALLKEAEFVYMPFLSKNDLLSFKSQLHRERNILRTDRFHRDFLIKQVIDEGKGEFSLRIYPTSPVPLPVIVSTDGSLRPLPFTEELQIGDDPIRVEASLLREETEEQRLARLMREDGLPESAIEEMLRRVKDGTHGDDSSND